MKHEMPKDIYQPQSRNIEAGNVFVLMGADRRFRVLRVDNVNEDSIYDMIQATERGESEAGQA